MKNIKFIAVILNIAMVVFLIALIVNPGLFMKTVPAVCNNIVKREYYTEPLDISVVYSLERYENDVTKRFSQYPEVFNVGVIGTTDRGHSIYQIKMGTGQNKIFVSAGVHARENPNTPLLMQTIDNLACAYLNGDERVADAFKNTTFVFIPLVNPDGYELCYLSANGEIKTNARGVDINRNFPFAYRSDTVKELGNYYPGESAGSEKETQAVINCLNSEKFSFALDIHSRGQIIYAYKGGVTQADMISDANPEQLNSLIMDDAQKISNITGYPIQQELQVEDSEEGTVTDYAFTLGIPTISIETLPMIDLPAAPEAIVNESSRLNLFEVLLTLATLPKEG